ncbi:hypothetical protein DB44_FB00040 [Candidatus Protochlamydia amoebophila]|uniref:Uncharacterized protein n=1 Tax=Candidatus Protochlamydia amoebophila TaxID=362787 RepID=A0A0C1JK54_9BACT|nr:hypothetical protein DB44_FB00040 [Candidatus Protochlamydia amoebophila]
MRFYRHGKQIVDSRPDFSKRKKFFAKVNPQLAKPNKETKEQ